MPRGKPAASQEPAVITELRAAIEDSKANPYQLAKKAGIDQSAVRKFLSRERSLSLDSGARLCEALGLKLVRPARPRKFAGAERGEREREGPRPVATPPGPSGTGMDYAAGSGGPPDDLAGSVDRLVPAAGPGGHHADET